MNRRLSARVNRPGRCHRATVGAWCLLLMSCGTGIEVTEHVTNKDVRRAIEQVDSHQTIITLEAYQDSLPAWEIGKRFWVTDNQVTQLLAHQEGYDKDTLSLAGHVVNYVGHHTGGLYNDDNRYIFIDFLDSLNNLTYSCRAGRAADAFRRGFSIPMLIDLDMVEHYARQVVGKDYYIRTSIWYERKTEKMIDGRHFIKVHIDSVLPGNAVLPMRVLFTTADSHEQAMVWMSDQTSTMQGRSFDAMFVSSDPHLAYPAITDVNWERITRSQVVEGMTKEECRLALGTPKRINEVPDQAGMREYWYYDGGSYLFFVDGLLRQFRK